MLFIEIKPNVVVSFGVERKRNLEKDKAAAETKKKLNKELLLL